VVGSLAMPLVVSLKLGEYGGDMEELAEFSSISSSASIPSLYSPAVLEGGWSLSSSLAAVKSPPSSMNRSETSPGLTQSLLLAPDWHCLVGAQEVMHREGDTLSTFCTILKVIMADFSLFTDGRAKRQGLAGFLGVLGVARAEEWN